MIIVSSQGVYGFDYLTEFKNSYVGALIADLHNFVDLFHGVKNNSAFADYAIIKLSMLDDDIEIISEFVCGDDTVVIGDMSSIFDDAIMVTSIFLVIL